MLVGRELGIAQAKRKAEQLISSQGVEPHCLWVGQILTRAQAKVTRLDRGMLYRGSGEIRNETVCKAGLSGAGEMPAVTNTACGYRCRWPGWGWWGSGGAGAEGQAAGLAPRGRGKAVTLTYLQAEMERTDL